MSALAAQAVLWSPRAFVGAPEPHVMPRGLTVADYVMRLPGMTQALADRVVVTADGAELERAMWPYMRPKEAVTLAVAIELGDTKTVATFASIALLAASVFAPPLLGLAAGSFAASALSLGIAVGGTLALNALFQAPSTAAAVQPAATPLNNASIAGNQIAKGKTLKRTLGTCRVAPDFITYPLTEYVGDDVYVEAVAMLGGPHQWGTIRLGETEATDPSLSGDIQIETRQGIRGEAPLSLVRRYSWPLSVNVTLPQIAVAGNASQQVANQADPNANLPGWTRVATVGTPDEIWMPLTWVEGLYDEASATTIQRQAIRLRLRKLGDTAWINVPEIHFILARNQQFVRTIKLTWDFAAWFLGQETTPSEGFVNSYTASVDNTSGFDPVWTATPFAGGHAMGVSLHKDRAEIAMSYAPYYDLPKGAYEIEILASAVITNSSFNTSTYNKSLFGFFLSGGVYITSDIQGTRHSKISIGTVSAVVNDDPAPLGEDAVIAIRFRNRTFDALSAEAAGLVPVYDAAAGEWSGLSPSANPADHLRAIASGPLTALPLPADLLDAATLLAFRQFCEANSLTISAVLDGSKSLWDAAVMAAGAGHGEPRFSDLWGAIWERDRSAEDPVQIFSPRNSQRGPFTKAFDRRPDAYIVTFPDPALAWQDNQITIYDDGVDPENPALLYEELRLDFVASADAAAAIALQQLRKNRLRDTVFQRTCAWNARMVIRGDLVETQDEVWDHDTGSALVKSVATSGGLVTGLVLDAEVPIVDEPLLNAVVDLRLVNNVRLLGKMSGARLHLLDGTTLAKALSGSTGSTTTLAFATPFAMPQADFGDGPEDMLVPECLVAVGPLALESRRQLVTGISKKSDTELTLTLVDEAPGIFA